MFTTRKYHVREDRRIDGIGDEVDYLFTESEGKLTITAPTQSGCFKKSAVEQSIENCRCGVMLFLQDLMSMPKDEHDIGLYAGETKFEVTYEKGHKVSKEIIETVVTTLDHWLDLEAERLTEAIDDDEEDEEDADDTPAPAATEADAEDPKDESEPDSDEDEEEAPASAPPEVTRLSDDTKDWSDADIIAYINGKADF